MKFEELGLPVQALYGLFADGQPHGLEEAGKYLGEHGFPDALDYASRQLDLLYSSAFVSYDRDKDRWKRSG